MGVLIVIVTVLCLCCGVLRWNEVRYRRKRLPPGTMGWPVVGETTEFLKQGPEFMRKKRGRYGSVFKSHLLGCPTIVSMDPEVNRFILMNEWRGLVPGYPQSMLHILGRRNIAAVHGATHKVMRSALLSLVAPGVMRRSLLPKIDSFMRGHLARWGGQVVNIQAETKEMALLSSLNQIAEETETHFSYRDFKAHFFNLVLGTLSLPIHLPATNYTRGLHARNQIVTMLTHLITHRRRTMNHEHHPDDMLASLLRQPKLDDHDIIDQIITILYSGYETVSTTSMMALKFLHDHPNALQHLRVSSSYMMAYTILSFSLFIHSFSFSLQKEHLEIRRNKNPEDPLDFNDLKSMTFTRAVR